MRNDRIAAVVRKEWAMLRRQKMVLRTAIGVPILITAIACGLLAIASLAPERAAPGHELPAQLAQGAQSAREGLMTMMSHLGVALLLLVPTIIPSMSATHSVIGEKQARTLEPLLATPLRTWELLTAKLVACVVPGVIAGWASAIAYAAVVFGVSSPHTAARILSPTWVLSLGVLAPLMAVLAVVLSLAVSSRVNDVQSAQAASVFVVLPVIGFGVSQTAGLLILSPAVLLGIIAVVAALDAGALALCVSLFERETVLTRWR